MNRIYQEGNYVYWENEGTLHGAYNMMYESIDGHRTLYHLLLSSTGFIVDPNLKQEYELYIEANLIATKYDRKNG